MTLRFGTDGVRGVAGSELTAEIALALGRATASVLGAGRIVVGRDTRISGPMLEAAFAAGASLEGAHVELLGVVPSPVVAHHCAVGGVSGAMVSASHNPFQDNGIKVFGPGGHKLDDATEERLEAALDTFLALGDPQLSEDTAGRVETNHAPFDGWLDRIVGALEGRRLDGMRLVVDCANGSASPVAAELFERVGADARIICDHPDGRNINAGCGSTSPDALVAAVLQSPGSIGVAFDGDADRVLLVDEDGRLVDGDRMIAICAADLRARGLLANDTVVVTVMANLGFHRAMHEQGIEVVQTAVGDRHVLAALRAGGHSLGGEQSGHVIFSDVATTGDGPLTALMVLDAVARSGRTLAEVAAASMVRLPQVLRNVTVDGDASDALAGMAPAVAAAEEELGDDGRVLLRPSGTEPLIRVMVEAATEAVAEAVADRLVEDLKAQAAR